MGVYIQFKQVSTTGVGGYEGCDMYVRVRDVDGRHYRFGLMSFVDTSAAITAGREVMGQSCKFAHPKLDMTSGQGDTVCGSLEYAGLTGANATMPYKHTPLDEVEALAYVQLPELNLELVPDVTGATKVAQLVAAHHVGLHMDKAWTGPARLELVPHAMAPIA